MIRPVLTFIQYVGWSEDNVCQEPAHLYNSCTKKCLHFDCLTLLHHINCVQKWLIWFYTLLPWFDFLMMVPWGSKQVGIWSVTSWYKYRRDTFVHFVALESGKSVIDNAQNEVYDVCQWHLVHKGCRTAALSEVLRKIKLNVWIKVFFRIYLQYLTGYYVILNSYNRGGFYAHKWKASGLCPTQTLHDG
jgi:hypothetical protein